jgi:hypothetical protein
MIYRLLSLTLSLTLIGLGVAMLAVTLARGGGSLGFILGPMFVAAGAGRIYVLGKRE